MLPLPVLERAAGELVCYPGAGCSVMEMSHRSRSFEDILFGAEAALRRLMNIPDDYAVLFLQGGATMQFSMVPMNLAPRGGTFDYAVTGQFAQKALEEAARWGNAVPIASSADKNHSYIPAITPQMLSKDAAYLHITVNNTIFGTSFAEPPETGGVPLVGDMSSIILGRQYDVTRFGLIYAGAQKNMAPSGLTVVIIKNSLIPADVDPVVPVMLRYKPMADSKSMYNTPPCYSIYIAGLVFEWMESMGGVAEMERRNTEKANLLYDVIDNSRLFFAPAQKDARSITNVVFRLRDAQMTEDFLKMAKERGMINLKGHRSAGGCRASIYNGMPLEGVQALAECIQAFDAGRR